MPNGEQHNDGPGTQPAGAQASVAVPPTVQPKDSEPAATLTSKFKAFAECRDTTGTVFDDALYNVVTRANSSSLNTYLDLQAKCLALGADLANSPDIKVDKYRKAIVATTGRIRLEQLAIENGRAPLADKKLLSGNQAVILSMMRANESREWQSALDSLGGSARKSGWSGATIFIYAILLGVAVMKYYKVTPESVRLYFNKKHEKNDSFFTKPDDTGEK
jgi:hypothetical protein